MKLRRLAIDNFRAIRHTEISFEDPLGRMRPMTVLAGPNGSGKTSVLFAIVQTLRYVMRYRTDQVPPPDDWDVHRVTAEDTIFAAERPHASVSLDLQFGDPEVAAIRRVLTELSIRPEGSDVPRDLQALKMLQLDNGRVSVEWQYPSFNWDGSRRPANSLHRCDPPAARGLFLGRSRAVSGYRSSMLTDRSLLDAIGGICIFPQDRNLQERVVGERSARSSVPDGLFPHGGGAPDAEDEEEEQQRAGGQRVIADVLQYLSSYAKDHMGVLSDEQNWEKQIQERFGKICAPKRYLGFKFYRDDPRGRAFFEDGASVYPLEKAASGEQVILEYITRLIHPSPLHHSLILIDEPELHMHPGWIRQVYQALPQIGEDNQFVLTTHSPEFRTLAAQDGALVDMGELAPVP